MMLWAMRFNSLRGHESLREVSEMISDEEYTKAIGGLRTSHQRSLNNMYIWCSIAIRALKDSLENEKFISATRFKVPSKTRVKAPARIRHKTVSRDSDKVREVITKASDQDLYVSVFVFAVAQMEAFLNDLISAALRFDNRRLKTRVQGIDHTKRIDIEEVVDCATKEDLIDSIIQKELTALFYASPSQQFEYLHRVVGAEVDEAVKNAWIEFRASRDLIVHNSGIINSIYLSKCGPLARGKNGESVQIDEAYFSYAIAVMKSLIGQSTSSLQRSLRGVTKLPPGRVLG
jgi:hypothetical protein